MDEATGTVRIIVADHYWQHRAHGTLFGLVCANQTARFRVYHGFTDPTDITVKAGVNPKKWTHFVGVYEPKEHTIRLYVDGQLKGKKNMPAPMRSSIPPYLYVCGSWHGTEPGTVDEIRIYDQGLSAAEVSGLRALPLSSKADDRGAVLRELAIAEKAGRVQLRAGEASE